ncbi:MAG: DedA family protein [Deltaproteobacteria bacterium]|nr:DedA family protein [Deltaproteobacteria bacterium]
MDLSYVESLVQNYGYWALFVGTFLEGETFFILAGVAAGQGLLNPWLVALTALSGGFLGDQIFFFLGHWRGRWVVHMTSRLTAKARIATLLIRRHAVPLMLFSRFLYGLRMVVPLACGSAGVRPLRFMVLNFISAVIWALTFGSLGYWAGGWIFSRMNVLKGLQVLALIVLGALALSVIIGGYVRRLMLPQAGAPKEGRDKPSSTSTSPAPEDRP